MEFETSDFGNSDPFTSFDNQGESPTLDFDDHYENSWDG